MGDGVGYDFAMELSDASSDNAKETVQKLIRFVKKTCKRVLKVLTVATPSAGGRAYIYAGMDAGYEYLLTIGTKHNSHFNHHETAKLSEDFQQKRPYKKDDIGIVVDPVLDQLVEEEGNVWFLCKMIK